MLEPDEASSAGAACATTPPVVEPDEASIPAASVESVVEPKVASVQVQHMRQLRIHRLMVHRQARRPCRLRLMMQWMKKPSVSERHCAGCLSEPPSPSLFNFSTEVFVCGLTVLCQPTRGVAGCH